MKDWKKKQNIDALFSNVAWPAAAGNVFWAISTIFVDDVLVRAGESPTPVRVVGWELATLFVLGAYMSLQWLRIRVEPTLDVTEKDGVVENVSLVTPSSRGVRYWVADAIHLASFCVFANSVSGALDVQPTLVLFFVLGFTALGHFFGVWEDERNGATSAESGLLCAVNAIGLLILLAFYLVDQETQLYPENICISLGAALVLWAGARYWLDNESSSSEA